MKKGCNLIYFLLQEISFPWYLKEHLVIRSHPYAFLWQGWDFLFFPKKQFQRKPVYIILLYKILLWWFDDWQADTCFKYLKTPKHTSKRMKKKIMLKLQNYFKTDWKYISNRVSLGRENTGISMPDNSFMSIRRYEKIWCILHSYMYSVCFNSFKGACPKNHGKRNFVIERSFLTLTYHVRWEKKK